MKKVVVIGISGSGKSYFAARLGEKLGIPVHHLDRMYWHPGWVKPDKDPFHAKIREIAAGNTWIVDGNYGRSLLERIDRADAVFFLDLNKWYCMWQVLKRNWKHRGSTRADMAEGCEEELSFRFLKGMILSSRSSPEILSVLEQVKDTKKVSIFRTRSEVNNFLNSLTVTR